MATFTEQECEWCRRDFPSIGHELEGVPIAYFDGPAGTQVPQPVIDAVAGYYRTCNANTHGQFSTSRETDQILHETRETVAAFLGAPSWREISFGANMTTLCFALSRALARAWQPGDEVVITQLDHEANRGPWLALQERGIVVREVALRPDGTLDPEGMAQAITPRTRLLAIGAASNALGTVNDLAAARRLTREVGAFLLVDAVHAAPHFPMHVETLDTDFLLCSAYKFYGPHVGILYSRPGLLDALATDRLSTQDAAAPFRIETGTQNHAALAGVKAAIEYIASWGDGETLREQLVSAMEAVMIRERELARRYFEGVRAVRGVRVWGPGFDGGHRAPTVAITVEGVPSPEVARRLGEQGIQVWDGHFYAARAIESLGLADRGGVVRSGMAMYVTSTEVDRLIAAVAEIAGNQM
ncbi:MAG TPA: cysteine desulfurase-like protein [Thermoanaerobaculaceae bacterium]|nr:cysteine desulfurase-like protein [Thermoanaerobaculaceae bacterium]HPS79091.1 cysteine desulfurase-like protein [Thermoanaerobaculaceae bacterium]